MSRPTTIIDIFARIDVCEHGTSCTQCCWLWRGGIDRYGYGKCQFNKSYALPHRVLYQQQQGLQLTQDQLVLHTCDIPLCCNWNHLYVGTHRSNTDDKMSRGRHKPVRGVLNVHSRVTETQVYQMRRNYHSGGWTIADLCYVFGPGKSVVQRILVRKDWSHLQGELTR